jgi:hypothetical protein
METFCMCSRFTSSLLKFVSKPFSIKCPWYFEKVKYRYRYLYGTGIFNLKYFSKDLQVPALCSTRYRYLMGG